MIDFPLVASYHRLAMLMKDLHVAPQMSDSQHHFDGLKNKNMITFSVSKTLCVLQVKV